MESRVLREMKLSLYIDSSKLSQGTESGVFCEDLDSRKSATLN